MHAPGENTCNETVLETTQDIQRPAPDPDIEIMQKPSIQNSSSFSSSNTPVAAWILVLLLLIFTLKKNMSDSVVGEIFKIFSTSAIRKRKQTKPYSKPVMIFCMTLAGYSFRAYRYLREVFQNCVPSEKTLRNYRKRVDGSPGFSAAALRMISRKVTEMKETSKNLFVSLSCDDMSIRQHIWFTGTTFHGYEDLGDGLGEKPAKHVMMMMATALNMSWKIPVGYFLIPDAFSSEKRAELLQNCIFHLNGTGAIVTSLVMDNCPVNYATFRRLGCRLARNYEDLNTCLDIKNNLGKNVLALFDSPHMSKLGKYFLRVAKKFYTIDI